VLISSFVVGLGGKIIVQYYVERGSRISNGTPIMHVRLDNERAIQRGDETFALLLLYVAGSLLMKEGISTVTILRTTRTHRRMQNSLSSNNV
jgi:hypothetical protein